MWIGANCVVNGAMLSIGWAITFWPSVGLATLILPINQDNVWDGLFYKQYSLNDKNKLASIIIDNLTTNQALSSTSTTVTLLKNARHGTYSTPLSWNITIDTLWAINWPVIKMHHAQGTIPSIIGWTVVSGSYSTTVSNYLLIEYDWVNAFVRIEQNII
jgi:hypothetical protein